MKLSNLYHEQHQMNTFLQNQGSLDTHGHLLLSLNSIMQTTSINHNYKPPMNTKPGISKNYLLELYQSHNLGDESEPLLQIIGFQQSLRNPHTQIIIRLSDQTTFIDCSVIGPYTLKNNKIVCTSDNLHHEPIILEIFDLVRLTDSFIKIDQKKICHLQIIIRKLELIDHIEHRLGLPQQLSQYYQYFLEQKQRSYTTHETDNSEEQKKESEESQEKQMKCLSSESKEHQKLAVHYSLNQIPIDNFDGNNIKQIEEPDKQVEVKNIKIQNSNLIIHEIHNNAEPINLNNNLKKQIKTETLKQQKFLTYQEVLQGKQGSFIGRLVRTKLASKQTREGPISVLYLGFIDQNGELARINLAGRNALRQAKVIKKDHCYCLKGLDLYKNDKMPKAQIRMKDKDSKIIQINSAKVQKLLEYSHYNWDHQNKSYNTQNVDVIGVIDEIQDKTSYSQAKSGQNREVIRIVIRNVYKIVKVSFWAEQISSLHILKLRKGEPVIMQDIKRKKNMFLDFTIQSNVLKLNEHEKLKKQFENLLPIDEEEQRDPDNISQLLDYFSNFMTSGKIYYVSAFLTKLHEHRIIYKLCENCNKKVQKFSEYCNSCKLTNFFYKFNCQLQFADYSGSIQGVAFDYTAQKILGYTSHEISQMDSNRLQQVIDSCTYIEYLIGVENRNGKMIVRSIQKLDDIKSQSTNISKIKQKVFNANKN